MVVIVLHHKFTVRTVYKHKCLENIYRLYMKTGIYDEKQKLKSTIEAEIFPLQNT